MVWEHDAIESKKTPMLRPSKPIDQKLESWRSTNREVSGREMEKRKAKERKRKGRSNKRSKRIRRTGAKQKGKKGREKRKLGKAGENQARTSSIAR